MLILDVNDDGVDPGLHLINSRAIIYRKAKTSNFEVVGSSDNKTKKKTDYILASISDRLLCARRIST
jgi:hypothetical protein